MQKAKNDLVLKYFEEISKIPRPSGKEKKVSDWVCKIAKKMKLSFERDKARNVVIRVPAKKGYEDKPVVVLQAHLDMVCEKNSNVVHDFEKDPIELIYEGDKIKAKGTTLGADNGIGVAMALAILDDSDVVHAPLELLFTTDEERGLNGAKSLSKDFIKGRKLINLDTEEEGAIYIGCAGGTDTIITLRINRGEEKEKEQYLVKVTGLRGGHSGGDIHEGRGNANQIIVRILRELVKAGINYDLIKVYGGSKRNAIPREAFALISFEEKLYEKVREFLKKINETISFELRNVEKNIVIDIEKQGIGKFRPFTEKFKKKALDLLFSIPHGVISYDKEIKDLVETSTNFAIIETEDKKLNIITSQRSNIMSRLNWASERVRVLGELVKAKAKSVGTYHGWTPNLNSPLLRMAKEVYKRLTGEEAREKAIHAGLECGILGEKYEGIDMISIGPTIKNAHSPDEELSISSVERTYKFLKELLKEIATKS